MTSAKVDETSFAATDGISTQDYPHPDEQATRLYVNNSNINTNNDNNNNNNNKQKIYTAPVS